MMKQKHYKQRRTIEQIR